MIREPPDKIITAPSESTVILLEEGTVSDNPDGIVNTTPDETITFAGAVAVLARLQLVVIIQSPDTGGAHVAIDLK